MLTSPRFGRIGLGAMPDLMGVKYLGPLLEVAGSRSCRRAGRWACRRYREPRHLLRLAGAAVVESVGLRQLHSWWRLVALLLAGAAAGVEQRAEGDHARYGPLRFAQGDNRRQCEDLLLAPLRGYPPFDALLKPDN
jgi:hypothetical protein